PGCRRRPSRVTDRCKGLRRPGPRLLSRLDRSIRLTPVLPLRAEERSSLPDPFPLGVGRTITRGVHEESRITTGNGFRFSEWVLGIGNGALNAVSRLKILSILSH